MNGKLTIESDLSRITPSALKAYADRGGWQDVEPYGDVGRIYVLGRGTPNIIIPNSTDFADYNSVLHRVIEIMADAEERDWDSVARDLILADTNQVQVRLIDAYDDGSIPAQAGVTLIQNSWKMIVAAARSAANPELEFKGKYGTKIREYLKTVRLGQTDRGSFVVNLLSPSPIDDTFSDKIVVTLVSGLEAIREVLTYNYHLQSNWKFDEYVERGMSVNLCDAVASILTTGGDSGLEVSVHWAINSHANSNQTSSIAFDKTCAGKLKLARSTLRSAANTTKLSIKEQVHVFR